MHAFTQQYGFGLFESGDRKEVTQNKIVSMFESKIYLNIALSESQTMQQVKHRNRRHQRNVSGDGRKYQASPMTEADDNEC